MPQPASAQRGTTMIEVLVTLIIILIGLLGLAALQSRMQVSEMESYQRSQALVLLDDMANRLAANRYLAANYATDGTYGVKPNPECPTITTTSTQAEKDRAEWCNLLDGAAELKDTSRVGAMIGARGCIQSLGTNTNSYMITVAWQGLAPLSAPPANVTCGLNLYNGSSGSTCVDDRCRRAITKIVRIATL